MSTDFENASNWGGVLPLNNLTSDKAKFDGAATYSPVLSQNRSINGLKFQTSGWALNFGNTYTLTLGDGGIETRTAGAVSITGNLRLGTSQAFLLTTDSELTITNSIAGDAAFTLTKSGAGKLFMQVSNSYDGLTDIRGGLVVVSTNNALGSVTSGTSVNGGTLGFQGNVNYSTAEALSIEGALAVENLSGTNSFAGAISMTNTGAITSTAGTLTLSGTINNNNHLLTATGAGDLAFSGVVSGGQGLTKTGTGSLTLSNSNTYAGTTTISGGKVIVTSNNALGTSVGDTDVKPGGTLAFQGGVNYSTAEAVNIEGTLGIENISGTNSFAGPIKVVNAGTIASTAGTLTLSGAINNNNKLLTVTGAGDLVFSGVVSGGEGLVKSGPGTLTLSGVNTYVKPTTINGGTIAINSSESLGAIGAGLTINAGTLQVTSTFSTTRSITLGNVASTFQIDPGQTYTVSNPIGGAGTLNKTGTGTMVLSGANGYSGGTVVSNGTLRISANERLLNAGTLTISGGTFDLQTFTETTGPVTLTSGSISGSGSGTLIGSSYSMEEGTVFAILSGTGVLTKTTSGTVTLSGANTFSGVTTVSGGTLTLASGSGSALGSTSSVTVNSGGTLMLGANNQINNTGTMTLAGGTFGKGNFSEGSAASLGLGALTLTASGSQIDFGSGTVGVLSFASLSPGNFTLTVTNWTGTPGTVGSGSTDRLVFNSDQSANLGSFVFDGYSGATQFNLGGGYYEITPLTAVPEPSTYIAAVFVLATIGFRHARRVRGTSKRA